MWRNPKYFDSSSQVDMKTTAESQGPPPAESGQRLATFDRSKPGQGEEEVRIELNQFNGRPFVNLRIWFKSPHDGRYYPTRKGVSIRISELEEAAEALLSAHRIASQDRPPQRPAKRHPIGQSKPQSIRPSDGSMFDEFSE